MFEQLLDTQIEALERREREQLGTVGSDSQRDLRPPQTTVHRGVARELGELFVEEVLNSLFQIKGSRVTESQTNGVRVFVDTVKLSS